MKIFNPTGWKREIKIDSRDFVIKPFGVHEFFDDYAKLIASSDTYRAMGIVHLDYEGQERVKYRNFETFKRAQAIKGLKALLADLKRLQGLQLSAYNTIEKERSNSENKAVVINRINVNKFDADQDLVERWLSVWEGYRPPDFVESEDFVEVKPELVVESFDPAKAGQESDPYLTSFLPKGLENEELKKPRVGRKPRNESIHDSNAGA